MNLHNRNFSQLSVVTELPVETNVIDARRMPPPDGHPGLAAHD